MSAVHGVLLVPHEGGPHGLLAEGPCGARPPIVTEWGHAPGITHWGSLASAERTFQWMRTGRRGLGLAWGGRALKRSCRDVDDERAPRRDCGVHHHVRRAVMYPHLLDVTLPMLQKACADIGTIVLIDADGREVTGE